MDGWMEYWTPQRARELRQEVHQARLVRDLKAARRGEFPSTPYQRLLDWLVRTGQHWREVRASRKPSRECC
jgi:hypothetical protein